MKKHIQHTHVIPKLTIERYLYQNRDPYRYTYDEQLRQAVMRYLGIPDCKIINIRVFKETVHVTEEL